MFITKPSSCRIKEITLEEDALNRFSKDCLDPTSKWINTPKPLEGYNLRHDVVKVYPKHPQ